MFQRANSESKEQMDPLSSKILKAEYNKHFIQNTKIN
jgi:hypothetical protein